MTAPPALPIDPDTVKGFLDADEGAALFEAARDCAIFGPLVEIGGYCGKSALYLGTAARDAGGLLFSIDHHRGSEENQPGWEWHDASLWDAEAGALDTLPHFRATMRRAGLESSVVPVVARSGDVARYWRCPVAMLFVDGGHTMEAALADYRNWAGHVMLGGLLAIHDVFPDPADGGRPPFEVFELARTSGLFAEERAVKSLRLLRRL